MTGADSSSAPFNWRSLFEAAVLELDPQKILRRIDDAERVITEQLKTDGNDGDCEAMLNALSPWGICAEWLADKVRVASGLVAADDTVVEKVGKLNFSSEFKLCKKTVRVLVELA
jgi:hypothetical protein